MASLFKVDTKDWDREILLDIFYDRDRQAILNTVIEHDLDKDILCWNLEHTGHYSVKSVCRLIQQQKGVWNEGNNIDFWKSIWNIKAPPQVMNLIWRVSTFCLPTLVQLQTKHVRVNNMCPVCNEAAETIIHILVQCKVAKACWQVFKDGTNIEGALEFTDWLAGILEGQSKNNKAKILTMCWSIWRSRNDLVWHNKRWTVLRIVAKVWEYLS
ncbi:uncharacterized protein LOC141660070 [Apium graveolens]|uniref:uncharacterized protein LOC141660070 n=1 Tax=Apium graveolens TaxID=4045 RepID=UPI003D7B6D78